jgi:hypothetical protein
MIKISLQTKPYRYTVYTYLFVLVAFFWLAAKTAYGDERIEVQRLSASTWQIDNGSWHYRNSFDGRLTTSWGTGRYFSPNVEWLQLSFDTEAVLERLEIATGLQGDPANFARNGRPREILLHFSDGSSQKILLADQLGYQNISLQPVKTRWLRLLVTKIYWGDRSSELTSDFGIAELRCYGSMFLQPKPLVPIRGVINLETQPNALGTTPLQK